MFKIKEILKNVKEFFSNLKERVVIFYQENKKLSYIIISLTALILICLILLICIWTKNGKKSKEISKPVLILDKPLVIPSGPELPRDYNISRKTQEKWTEEEAEKWFTIPGEKEIESLSKSNENMINEITGAAP